MLLTEEDKLWYTLHGISTDDIILIGVWDLLILFLHTKTSTGVSSLGPSEDFCGKVILLYNYGAGQLEIYEPGCKDYYSLKSAEERIKYKTNDLIYVATEIHNILKEPKILIEYLSSEELHIAAKNRSKTYYPLKGNKEELNCFIAKIYPLKEN